jgi:hypothetical protein
MDNGGSPSPQPGTTGSTGTTSSGSKGSTGSTTSGVDPDLTDPSIVGTQPPPFSGSTGPQVKCVVNPSTTCTTDTWTNYAKNAMNGACGSCHSLYGGSCDTVLSDRSVILDRIGSGSMPPSGGLAAGDKTRLTTWLNCGAPL